MRAERFCVFEVRVWAGIAHGVLKDHADPPPPRPIVPARARLVARGEAVPVSPDTKEGCPSAHTAPAGLPHASLWTRKEEVRAAQDEVKQLKAQLAALQQLQASPPKLRQGLKIPGLKNTGTTLNYIADGAGIRDNDPLNRPRRSPPRRPQRGGPSEEWWNWELVDAPKPKANLRRGVQATNLLQPQWPQPRVAPAISRDATPPLLPGWKEPSYKSPLAKTEPKLRVGLQIPSLDEARRKPEAHHTVASKKFSVSLPAPSPEEDRVHKEFRTTPRFSPDEKPKKRRSPEEKPRRRRFPVVPHQVRASSTSSRTTSPARGRRRDVECMRGGPTSSYRLSSGRRGGGRSGTRHRRRRRRDDTSARSWAAARRRPGRSARTSGAPGVARDQPAVGRVIATRRRLGRVALHPRAQPADGAEQHPHGAVVN